jgi:hypothetical protein
LAKIARVNFEGSIEQFAATNVGEGPKCVNGLCGVTPILLGKTGERAIFGCL